MTSLYSLHRNPLYFPEPEKFVPERWLESGADEQRAALHPFSTGNRSCIGKHLAMQVLRLMIARLVVEFDGRYEGDENDWTAENQCYAVWEVPECRVSWHIRSRE